MFQFWNCRDAHALSEEESESDNVITKICPNCEVLPISNGFNFCSKCGCKLRERSTFSVQLASLEASKGVAGVNSDYRRAQDIHIFHNQDGSFNEVGVLSTQIDPDGNSDTESTLPDDHSFYVRGDTTYVGRSKDEVSILAFLGEVSKKEAKRVFQKQGTLEKSLLMIEARKMRNSFFCLIAIAVVLVCGLATIFCNFAFKFPVY